MDKVLPAKYIEAIYELEYDEEAGRWRHQLFLSPIGSKVDVARMQVGKTGQHSNHSLLGL
jgi:hypothetical protein